MAEGRNHFVFGWKAIGLLFIIVTSNYADVEGSSTYVFYESYATASVEAEEGGKGFIMCKVNASFDIVVWKRASDPPDYDLVVLDVSRTPPVRSGEGYEAGLFNITDDYSLVINDVKPTDGDVYQCTMTDYEHEVRYANTTSFYVYRKATPQRSTQATASLSTEQTHSTPKTAYAPDIQSTPQRSTQATANLSTEQTQSTPKTAYAPDIQWTPKGSTSANLSTENTKPTPTTMYASDIQRTLLRSTSTNLVTESTQKFTPEAVRGPKAYLYAIGSPMVQTNPVSTRNTLKTECPTDDLSTATLSAKTTPKTECPVDLVFKVLSGVSVGALALSWVLIGWCLLSKERQLAINDM